MTKLEAIAAAHSQAARYYEEAAAEAEQAGHTDQAAEYQGRAVQNRRLAREATS